MECEKKNRSLVFSGNMNVGNLLFPLNTNDSIYLIWYVSSVKIQQRSTMIVDLCCIFTTESQCSKFFLRVMGVQNCKEPNQFKVALTFNKIRRDKNFLFKDGMTVHNHKL